MCGVGGISDLFESDTAGAAGGPRRARVLPGANKGDALRWACGRHPHPGGRTARLRVEAERFTAGNGDADFKLNCGSASCDANARWN